MRRSRIAMNAGSYTIETRIHQLQSFKGMAYEMLLTHDFPVPYFLLVDIAAT